MIDLITFNITYTKRAKCEPHNSVIVNYQSLIFNYFFFKFKNNFLGDGPGNQIEEEGFF